MESDAQSELVNDSMTREAGRRAKRRRQKESPQEQDPVNSSTLGLISLVTQSQLDFVEDLVADKHESELSSHAHYAHDSCV